MVTETQAQKRIRAIVAFMVQHEQSKSQFWVIERLLEMGFTKSEIGVAFVTYVQTRV